jgi:inward rectifier potassium channel
LRASFAVTPLFYQFCPAPAAAGETFPGDPVSYLQQRRIARLNPNREQSNLIHYLKIPSMEKPTFDPGLTQKYTGSIRRIINEKGEFNVYRKGVNWRDINPYLYMISTSWPRFFLDVFAGYVVVNFLFAGLYWMVGVQHLHGANAPDAFDRFMNAFFFSAHTLTTVGYGSIYPEGVAANTVAVLEALMGLMSFALATGLLFGRFSRPAARLSFSRHMIVAPYKGGQSLQFRVANRRANNLTELQASVLLTTVEWVNGQQQRKYYLLPLERETVLFLPLTWTIVHPIEEASPLYGKTAEDLQAVQAEFLVLVKGFDDVFYQVLHTRHSYTYNEVVWGAKFASAFTTDSKGELVLEMDRLSQYEPANLTRDLPVPAAVNPAGIAETAP